jgi:hypothetical protein
MHRIMADGHRTHGGRVRARRPRRLRVEMPATVLVLRGFVPKSRASPRFPHGSSWRADCVTLPVHKQRGSAARMLPLQLGGDAAAGEARAGPSASSPVARDAVPAPIAFRPRRSSGCHSCGGRAAPPSPRTLVRRGHPSPRGRRRRRPSARSLLGVELPPRGAAGRCPWARAMASRAPTVRVTVDKTATRPQRGAAPLLRCRGPLASAWKSGGRIGSGRPRG